jgi:hypothetical protein
MKNNLSVMAFVVLLSFISPGAAQAENFPALNVEGRVVVGSATSRPITLWDNSGSIYMQGDSGGWAFGLHAKGALGSARAGFGFFGGNDGLEYLYIGENYLDPTVTIRPNTHRVGIGTTSPLSPLTVFNAFGGPDVYGLTLATGFAQGNAYAINPFISGVSNGGFSIYDITNAAMRLVIQQTTGNVGIGTARPAVRMQVTGTSFLERPTLGAADGGGLFVTNPDPGYGLLVGVSGSGTSWMQAQRVDGFGVFYALVLQPSGGNVGIGTTNPTEKLSVNGRIRAKEVVVETANWSDYVFAEDYDLMPLAQVAAHIKEKKHLPGIPSAEDIESQGISLGEMQAILLAKIEELTLHQIAQEEAQLAQAERIRVLESENSRLKELLK